MKHLLFLLLTGTNLLSFSQKIYKVSIAQTSAEIATGYLVAIKDTVLSLMPGAASIRFNAIAKKDLVNIHYSNIEEVAIQRNGSPVRGMLQGALIGFATGAITGLIMGDDPPCIPRQQDFFGLGNAICEAFRTTAGQKAVEKGSFGAAGGAVIGGIIGIVARKRFIIGGNKEKFQKMQMSVMDRMYGNIKAKNDRYE